VGLFSSGATAGSDDCINCKSFRREEILIWSEAKSVAFPFSILVGHLSGDGDGDAGGDWTGGVAMELVCHFFLRLRVGEGAGKGGQLPR